ncbi:MAG: urease accessory protein UreF [Hyphomicrobiaceae bacterium]
MSGVAADPETRPVPDRADRRFPVELGLWLSPSFPVGSFAYSHGLEWAVGDGRIHGRATATAWLCDLLEHGSPRNDAIVLTAAWRAVCNDCRAALREANDLALALAGTRERRLETVTQGGAFMAAMSAAWNDGRITHAAGMIDGEIAYPVAVGLASAAYGLPLGATLSAFAAAFVTNMTSALVRLAVIGQTDGQRVIVSLMPAIEKLAAVAGNSTLEDVGGAAFLSDIAAMAHETQDTRLFRT